MVLFDGARDTRLIESGIARYGEPVTFQTIRSESGVAFSTKAIPTYVDGTIELPNGEVKHLEGWMLTFRPEPDIPIGSIFTWRGSRWRVNDTSPMNTKLQCVVSAIPDDYDGG